MRTPRGTYRTHDTPTSLRHLRLLSYTAIHDVRPQLHHPLPPNRPSGAALDRAAASRILQGARSMAAMATATVRRTAAANAKDDDDADDEAVAAALREAGVGPLESGDASEAEEDDTVDAAAAAVAAADAGQGSDRSSGSSGSPEQDTWVTADSVVGAGGITSGGISGKSSRSADIGSTSTSTNSGNSSSSGSGSSRTSVAISVGGSRGLSSQSFESRWRDQLLREGLVGALVAAAYPDRIAERRQRPNSRPAFTLSTAPPP
ncbi:hypothetical protein Vretimale_5134 [Volvox reticuliferus]|uniref:Uncharacterized protein n=1 Tax=Volvox reticuliferus TaxID=1737510 RepID=A0A8J4G4R4_9CHLO|nr:hypothetical protein Vretimale_5134 [Volvox reticuliferus]